MTDWLNLPIAIMMSSAKKRLKILLQMGKQGSSAVKPPESTSPVIIIKVKVC